MTEKTPLARAGVDATPAGQSLLDAWLRHVVADFAPLTLRRYRGAVAHFLQWYEQIEGRALALADLHPITLTGYRGALQDAVATSTVNTHRCALRTWCSWLHGQGYLTHNPALRLKLVGRPAPMAPRALKAAHIHALLRQVQHTRERRRNTAIVQLLVQTGMRIGECAALRWEDIVYGERRGHIHIRAGKGNKARSLPLNDSARQALADYAAPLLGVAPTIKAVAAVWPQAAHAPFASLWRSERGQPLSVREMSRMIQWLVRDCAACGLVPMDATPHWSCPGWVALAAFW
jgi:site-specific recombinase XerD